MTRRFFQQLLSFGTLGLPLPPVWTDSEITKAKRLKVGDSVGLISPGSSVPKQKVEQAILTTRKLGLEPILGDHAMGEYGFLAGTDVERLADLHKMFTDPTIKAIWCIRGGYGCTRLLPKIDFEIIRQNPKVLIGYSDITALHLAIARKTGLVTFHGPVASSNPTEYTVDQLQLIFGEVPIIDLKPKATENKSQDFVTINPGIADGSLIGGNLSLLAALAGTAWSPSYARKLVFMEDVGEKPYRIDRMLVQLSQATDIRSAAGIILGTFHDCEPDPGDRSFSLRETLEKHFSDWQIPIAYGLPFGHIDDQITLPVGIRARFDSSTPTIHFLESALI